MNNLIDDNLKEAIENTSFEQQNESLKITVKQLCDDTWIEEGFYNKVLQLILKIVPSSELEQSYTAEMMCGEALWNSLKKDERIKAGKCVVDMVRKNLLPLRFAGTTKANSQLYQLK